jgi:hypothetical protein
VIYCGAGKYNDLQQIQTVALMMPIGNAARDSSRSTAKSTVVDCTPVQANSKLYVAAPN